MSTKTDRILSYLPGTFRPLPRSTVLYTFSDAFGTELQAAENSLAALMMAHWVDYADRGEELIADLACIAALYGLAPRGAPPVPPGSVCPPRPADETVEEFREHLKRYVRTFLQGTATVQGILRVAAEALGLHIADDYAEMDAWWTRPDDSLDTTGQRGGEAAELLFGAEWIAASGQPERPAQVVGPELGGQVDLAGAQALSLKVDGNAPVQIDLPVQASLQEIVTAINEELEGVGRLEGPRLALASPEFGPGSRLEVLEVDGDASPRLLGLRPHTYRGLAATPAQVTGIAPDGPIDMSGSQPRYLRLRIDGALLVEVDCAGAGDPGAVSLDTIRDQINAQLGQEVASHDGHRLTLSSTGSGSQSSIAFEAPAAQEATGRLFGPVSRFHMGRDPSPAGVVGGRDLSSGVDLSAGSKIRLQVDDDPPVTVDCAGQDPARTRPVEIVMALNEALGPGVASQDGRAVSLASIETGPQALLAFEPLPEDEDAAEMIFGIAPRTFQGAAATQATIEGAPDLSPGVNLWARHSVHVAVDGGELVEVDVRAQAGDPGAATLDEITGAFEAVLGDEVASHDGQHLVLRSPTAGAESSLAIQPLQIRQRRRFVTRALITDEAAQAILGFVHRQADGAPAEPARLVGEVDLSRGIDLREARFLRFALDGGPAQEVDFAASEYIPRPRVALLSEDEGAKGILAAINQVWPGVASHDGQHLILASQQASGGRIAFEPPAGGDARQALLGLEPGVFQGKAPTGVLFRGAVDLSAGVDLPAQAAIAVGVDGGPVVEIALTGDEAAQVTLAELSLAINTGLGGDYARDEAGLLGIASKLTGADSRVEFGAPGGSDVTEALFGFTPPRCYRGANAAPAEAIGLHDLPAEVDLRVARTLRLAVDGVQADVDCAAGQDDLEHVPVEDIVETINARFEDQVASYEGRRLILRSPTPGGVARLELLAYGGGDARSALFGKAPDIIEGSAPAPAEITGEVDLLAPVNLGERRLLRLAVNGDRPVDVDVAGPAPESTTLDDIVRQINAVIDGLASATDDDRLRLRSPATGAGSRLEVLPLRYLELIEYPPEPAADPPEDQPPRQVRHGDHWTVLNDGAAESCLAVEIEAPHGVAGPAVVDLGTGQRVRLAEVLRPGEVARMWRDLIGGLGAEIEAAGGALRPVPPEHILTNGGTQALLLPQGRSEWAFLDCCGARFNQARFGRAGGEPELYEMVTAEARPDLAPENDPDHLVGRLKQQPSTLVEAQVYDRAPIGYTAYAIPFRGPRLRKLTGGTDGDPARLYLREPDVPGVIELRAREPGAWGNAIAVTVRKSGPARYDVTIGYAGARLENARQVALAGRILEPGEAPLPALAQDLFKPGPVGVLQAKAAGVQAKVRRDG